MKTLPHEGGAPVPQSVGTALSPHPSTVECQGHFGAAMIDWEQGGVLNPPVPPAQVFRLIGSPAIYFSNNSSLFSMTASRFYVGIFLQDYFRGQRHRLLDDNIGGELIPNRLNHALQIAPAWSILLIKITVGMFIFRRAWNRIRVWACTPSLAEITKMAPSKTARAVHLRQKNPCGRAYTMLTLHLCHWKGSDCRLNGNPRCRSKNMVSVLVVLFDAPRF